MMRKAALFSLLAGLPLLAAASTDLARPSPGIGEGFATAMRDDYMKTFDLNAAEADCLVYEVTAEQRVSKDYSLSSHAIAEKVAPKCGLGGKVKAQ